MGVIYQVVRDGKTMKELYKEVFWDAVAILYLDCDGNNINLYMCLKITDLILKYVD